MYDLAIALIFTYITLYILYKYINTIGYISTHFQVGIPIINYMNKSVLTHSNIVDNYIYIYILIIFKYIKIDILIY